MQTHAEELLRLLQERARERNDEAGAVAHLALLRLARLHDHLGGGVDDLQLAHDSGGVGGDEQLAEVVDDHLVHAVGAERRAHDGAELLARLDVLQHRLIYAAQVLRALLEQPAHPLAGREAATGVHRHGSGMVRREYRFLGRLAVRSSSLLDKGAGRRLDQTQYSLQ